jgi:hypothetical protein
MKNGIYPALKLLNQSSQLKLLFSFKSGIIRSKEALISGFTKVRMLSLPNLENCHMMVVAFTRFLKRYRLLAEKR